MFLKYSGVVVVLFVVVSAVKARNLQNGRTEKKALPACQEALGMENGNIKDEQLSASSNWVADPPRIGAPNLVYGAKNARLNQFMPGSWTPAANSQNQDQWLQVSFGHPYTKITRIATQGVSLGQEWVTSYKLQYGDDGQNFQCYMDQEENIEKVFSGNTDHDSVVYNDINPPIRAAYIRFRPITWEYRISLRMELYGCIECKVALGMENGEIENEKITASSEYNANHGPDRSRLNIQINGAKIGAWVSRTNDADQWLQIDLGSQYTKVERVATQGRYNYEQWVKSYKLQYGDNEASFQYYREQGQTTDKVFSGNTDESTVVPHDLNPLIAKPYIRFRPVTWHNRIAMRVELYGCRSVLIESNPYRWKQCTTGLWESKTRLPKPNIPTLTWLQTPSIVQITTGHYQALGRVINARYLKERLTNKDANFDAADRETMDLVQQLDVQTDTFYIEGVVEFYGIRRLQIFARQIVASEGSKITVSTPNWNQEFDETSRTKFDGNGKDGERGNDGEEGPEVNIFCEVINGAFEVSSNAADGHIGQNGGPGADGLDNTPAVPDKTTDDCEAVGYDNCHNVDGAKGSKGKTGGNGGNAGVSGNGGTAGRVTIRYAKSTGTVQLKTCGGIGALPANNGIGGNGGEGGEGGRGAKCKTYYRKPWPVGVSTTGCEKYGDPLGRGPKGDIGDAGDPGSTPSVKGQDGSIDDSYVQSGTLDAASKQNFPKELLLLMRRQAEDLLLGNSNDRQARSTLEFILSIANERDDLEEIRKDAKRKLGFLGKAGYDIFGNNRLFAPLVKWGAIEENVEEIKNAAETYEKAINDIISTMTDEENFHQMASTMADVSSKGIKSEIARLEESKKIDESEKRMYVEAIATQEGRMTNILVTIQNMLPDVQKQVEEKLKRDELIATLQGITGFANAIAGKDPFEFIDTALNLAEYAVNQPCRSSLGSSLGSIKKWLTFGKEYKPLEDSSDLDFDAVDVNSVPEIMQANLEISKEKLAADLVCLLDEASKPSQTANLEAEIESYFIVGAARVDMIAKCMDLDNSIGGYNFDIPLLKDTETSVAELKKSPSASLSGNLRKSFTDNLLSTYRELERSFMEKLYALHKALGFRTLWTLDDVMQSFRRIASESALGTGRLNGAVELTDVLQNIRDIKSKAVTCFTTNPYSTDVKKWSFDNIKNKAMFDELAAAGKTTFSINIDRSCETCYNVRLLKIYIELFGTDEQPASVPAKIYLRIRHLSGSYFRSADEDQPIKPYRQPLGAYRTIKFDRFIISNEAKCRGGEGQCHTYCITEDDPRWTSMCDHSLNRAKSDQSNSLMGIEECKSPFGSYELKVPKDSDLDCTAEGGITNTNCKDLDLTKFTKMNLWMSVFYWSDQYPTGANDPICRSSLKKRHSIHFKTG